MDIYLILRSSEGYKHTSSALISIARAMPVPLIVRPLVSLPCHSRRNLWQSLISDTLRGHSAVYPQAVQAYFLRVFIKFTFAREWVNFVSQEHVNNYYVKLQVQIPSCPNISVKKFADAC